MLELLEKEIHKQKLKTGSISEIVKAVADSIPSQTIPYKMKLSLAVSELMLYASQFRINIEHWNGSSIPINSIMFCIAKSGASKDSSLKAARKCFEKGYETINKIRLKNAIDKAIKEAEENDEVDYDNFATYKKYLNSPNPLFLSISTTEGFIQHLNTLSDEEFGAGYIYSGEIGAELSSNPNMVENIKILSELYDEGNKEMKALKAKENQNREIKNFPASALFIGSQDNILFDDSIKKKFKTEFNTKLARRSFFVFVNEEIKLPDYNSIEEFLATERKIEDSAVANRKDVEEYILERTKFLIKKSNKMLKVSEKVRDLFLLYKRYNEEVSKTINTLYSMTKLTRSHIQWKAFKLAGALALIEGCDTIEEEHYKEAVNFLELISEDITDFEIELNKESYEQFTDFVRMNVYEGKCTVGLHTLRKAGFIANTSNSENALKELAILANSYDKNGFYTVKDKHIMFKELKQEQELLVSYVECSGTKEERAKKCHENFICESLLFKDLENMLKEDLAYIPFRFKNGKRKAENIDSKCKFIVFDVDNSVLTDKEMHFLLDGINHYVVRTSNKENDKKYRVLIELDTCIDVPNDRWVELVQIIANDLGIQCDTLPKSQIFYSYSDREILSDLEGKPLEIKKYLSQLSEVKTRKKLTQKAKNLALENRLTTFQRAFDAKNGEGRLRVLGACRKAKELGADEDYILDLVDEISDYWVKPFSDKELTVIKKSALKIARE